MEKNLLKFYRNSITYSSINRIKRKRNNFFQLSKLDKILFFSLSKNASFLPQNYILFLIQFLLPFFCEHLIFIVQRSENKPNLVPFNVRKKKEKKKKRNLTFFGLSPALFLSTYY